jgi:hypothetical protein
VVGSRLLRQEALSRFLADARLEIDNNIAENAMRGIALGRKNYLFAGSNAGGESAAAVCTIMQMAKLNERNPKTHLRDVLGRIAEGQRWTPPVGQFGGLVKLGFGCRQAANLSIPDAQYASSGVRPASLECGRRVL